MANQTMGQAGANSNTPGLRTGSTVTAMTEGLRTGVVWVNTPMMRELRAPFGGFKESGVGRQGGAACEAFFTEEYAVNEGIARFGKPWVSLIDGICMGGGIGLAIHNGPRVVSEHALLAMPETAIALFPDVGTSYVLPRLPGAIGNWLALTGARLTGGDAVHAGLATHFVPRARMADLRAALVETGDAAVVERFAEAPLEAGFAPHRAAIDRCFSQPSVLDIIGALEREGTEWAAEQVKILRRMSPTSLCVSLELLKRGAALDLRGCLDEELKLTRVVVHEHPDFREGVRSVLVDKDGSPSWTPATLEEVDHAAIKAMFA
jgi:enoyl-CoA hydratase/carnithine racemase